VRDQSQAANVQLSFAEGQCGISLRTASFQPSGPIFSVRNARGTVALRQSLYSERTTTGTITAFRNWESRGASPRPIVTARPCARWNNFCTAWTADALSLPPNACQKRAPRSHRRPFFLTAANSCGARSGSRIWKTSSNSRHFAKTAGLMADRRRRLSPQESCHGILATGTH
jgi:hypothetical protein